MHMLTKLLANRFVMIQHADLTAHELHHPKGERI